MSQYLRRHKKNQKQSTPVKSSVTKKVPQSIQIPQRNSPDFASQVLMLQRTIGNQATQDVLDQTMQREEDEQEAELEGIPAQLAQLKLIENEYIPALKQAGKEGNGQLFYAIVRTIVHEGELYHKANLPRKVLRMLSASSLKRKLILRSVSVMDKLDPVVKKYGKRGDDPEFAEALLLHRKHKKARRKQFDEKRKHKMTPLRVIKAGFDAKKDRKKKKKNAKEQAKFAEIRKQRGY